MVLQAIRYERGKLEILDQLRLPHELVYVKIKDPQDAWHAIKTMQVRGAPAIAIVAALSAAVCFKFLFDEEETMSKVSNRGSKYVKEAISQTLKFLSTSRPTAVNLVDAARKLEAITLKVSATHPPSHVVDAYVDAAEKMLRDDLRDNENIGSHGAKWIEDNAGKLSDQKVSIVTHCNTGALATAGYGTALGVIRSLHSRGSLRRVFYTETRPYNQGVRLTGFELLHDGIPAELITDSMSSLLLQTRQKTENIFCIVVGADRVVANGDTANKIGTYGLAITARFHGIKFLVAAPRTTIDISTKTGAEIRIEQRPATEVTRIKGPEVEYGTDGSISFGAVKEVAIAPQKTSAWNPSFDVTPAILIDGIITEEGVIEKDVNGSFHLDTIFPKQTSVENQGEGHLEMSGEASFPSWEEVLQMDADQVHPWRCWLQNPDGHKDCPLGGGPVGIQQKQSQQVT